MRRETVLIVCIVALFAGMFGVATLAPDALATDDTDGPTPQPHLDTQEVTITSERVDGQTVTLSIDLYLRQDARPRGLDADDAELRSENVSVRLRATDRETGLIADTTDLDVDPIEGERDFEVSGTITVDRDSAYDIEALVFQDDRRIEVGRTSVSGLDRLEPEYARSPVRFERFAGSDIPVVGYTVEAAGDEEADLGVSAYVTNTGDGDHDDVEVELIARQTDSNIIADSERVRVGDIRPGRTETAETTLTVPDGYNYYLDAVIWRDGVIVDTAREGATLNPNTTAPDVGRAEDEEEGVAVGDFVTDDAEEDVPAERDAVAEDEVEDDEQPGLGIAAALFALALVLAAVARIARRPTSPTPER